MYGLGRREAAGRAADLLEHIGLQPRWHPLRLRPPGSSQI